MIHWDYLVKSVGGAQLSETLNKMGALGWQCISLTWKEHIQVWTLVFEKEKDAC